MKITLIGKPIHKMRARHSSRAGYVVTYDPQADDKNDVKKRFNEALSKAINHESYEVAKEASALTRGNAFEVDWYFYLPVNESDSEGIKNAKLWGLELATCKPDYDNLEKFYLDCANGVIWPDDRMIVDAHAHKRFSEVPRMEVNVKIKKGLNMHNKVNQVIRTFSPTQFKEFLQDVRKLNDIDPDKTENLEADALGDFITNCACMLSEFASKYTKLLKKIEKHGDITEQVRNYNGELNRLKGVECAGNV